VLELLLLPVESWCSAGEGNLTNATRGWEVDSAVVYGWRRRCRFFLLEGRSSTTVTVLLKTTLLLLGREDCCWFRLGWWRLHYCRDWKWPSPTAATEGGFCLEFRLWRMRAADRVVWSLFFAGGGRWRVLWPMAVVPGQKEGKEGR
jgi:hypothetical protein